MLVAVNGPPGRRSPGGRERGLQDQARLLPTKAPAKPKPRTLRPSKALRSPTPFSLPKPSRACPTLAMRSAAGKPGLPMAGPHCVLPLEQPKLLVHPVASVQLFDCAEQPLLEVHSSPWEQFGPSVHCPSDVQSL